MCGIAGIVSYRPDQYCDNLKRDIRAMTASMEHRGNRESQFFTDAHHLCYMGHQRLAILDVSDGGRQPFVSSDGRYVLVHNGQIYNYRELAHELRERHGISCTASCDTEVLLYSYITWKERCLEKLNGQFAFAVWDTQEKTLFMARDPLGIKPLYWYYGPAYDGQVVFAWASELTALLSSSFITRATNKELIAHYLMYYSMHAPCTIIEGVYALRPGHYLTMSERGYTITPYSSPFSSREHTKRVSRDEALKTIRDLLIDAVSLRLRSDVPVGAFLSGGIDSTVITAIASRILGKKVPVFSMGFDEAGRGLDEVDRARAIAQELGCTQQVFTANDSTFALHIESFIDHLDQPSGDGLNTFLISSLASQHVSVVLSGLGGDELFLGYRYFFDMVRFDRVTQNSLMRQFVPALAHGAQRHRVFRSLAYRLRLQSLLSWPLQHEELYARRRMIFSPQEVQELLGIDETPDDHSGELSSIFANEPDVLNAFSQSELQWYIPGMLLRDADVMAMAWTLEARFPFLDRRLVSYMLSISSSLKTSGIHKYNKPLLVDAFRDILPKQCVTAPKKGFEMPVGFWLASVYREDIDHLSSLPWLNTEKTNIIIQTFYRDPREYLNVWTLLTLSKWLAKWDVSIYEEKKDDIVHSSWQGHWGRATQSSLSH